MATPNLFLVYVSDAGKATEFYSSLFGMTPVFTSPRYVAFEVAPNVLFAVWTGAEQPVSAEIPRCSEVGLMHDGDIDELFERWKSAGVRVVSEPYDEVFGRTFVVSDPDGNLVRVSPFD
ncbi:VOC family protein [Corynebacterium resistens]|uniref:VOC family protein n=1 Tax=Corynebacterium resistens TaxID=258224 RepID=UPI002354E2EC|nr:VOC family protein [Corynebacterium resistens]